MIIKWFKYGDLRIRYAIHPGKKDGVPLLMFNGIGQSLEGLQPLIDELADMSIVTFDVPGAGLSDTAILPWRYRQHATLAANLLDHIGFERAHVFGVSWGGGLALQFANQFPERTASMILAAAAPGHLMVPGSPKAYLRMFNLRRFWDNTYMRKIAGEIYGGQLRNNSAVAERLSERQHTPSYRGYVGQALAMFGWSSLPFLHRLKSRTLILHGSDDPLLPTVNARILAYLIPDSRVEIMDCGHLFILTRSTETSQKIREFVNTILPDEKGSDPDPVGR